MTTSLAFPPIIIATIGLILAAGIMLGLAHPPEFLNKTTASLFLGIWAAWFILFVTLRPTGLMRKPQTRSIWTVGFLLPVCAAVISPWEYIHFHEQDLKDDLLHYIGLVVFLSGAILQAATQYSLRYLAHPFNHQGSQPVFCANGPFKWIRFPIYSAACLIIFGISISFHSPVGTILLALTALVVWMITRKEERDLLDGYGDEYQEYRKNVPWRFIPHLI